MLRFSALVLAALFSGCVASVTGGNAGGSGTGSAGSLATGSGSGNTTAGSASTGSSASATSSGSASSSSGAPSTASSTGGSRSGSASSSTGGTTGAVGTPLTACGPLSTPGIYSLQNDVSSTASCFEIMADGITLNLNGHTITYGTTETAAPAVFGIYGAATWDFLFSQGGIAYGNPAGGSWDNLSVVGPGSITEGNCLNPSDRHIGSSAIHLGQSHGDGLSVSGVTFNICGDSAQAIYADSNGAGWSVHDNVVNDRVVTAQRRDYFQGVAIDCDGCDGEANPAGSEIFNNTLTGGPQGCIIFTEPDTAIHDNTCSQGNPRAAFTSASPSLVCEANPYTNAAGTEPANAGTQCSNDFGIYARMNGGEVYANHLSPEEGRGLFIGASDGAVVHDNVVDAAQELANNSEYSGCALGGAYGLQFDDQPTHGTAYGNQVTALANACAAAGLRVTDSEDASNVSHDNTYRGLRAPGASGGCDWLQGDGPCAYAASFDGTAAFTSRNDTFIGDSAILYFDWDGPNVQPVLLSPTFERGPDPDPAGFYFAVFRNGAGQISVHIRDATFGPGVDPTQNYLPAQSANNEAASLYFDWTLTLTVQNAAGNPITGASVAYTDTLGNAQCQTTTDASGLATCVLTAQRANNDTGANQMENRNPFSYRISAPGCTALTGSESISATTSETKKLTGC